MDRMSLEVRASMILLAGDEDAELPPEPDDEEVHVVLPGPEAIYVSGRVEFDAATLIRIADRATADVGDLTHAYSGELATPDRRLQILSTDFDVLGQVDVPTTSTLVSIYLTDLVEPDEILVAL